jgi:formylmethanofuran dehydrogenase subunit E-like metal-binding protein
VSLISIPISYGELIDKLTILEIKSERMTDPAKLANVREELELLGATWANDTASATDISAERAELKRINAALWEIEDEIRLKEKNQAFDARFIELARAVYITNDRRAAVKRAINEKLGSRLVEEKSYQSYGAS